MRSPARSNELGRSWPTTRCATSAAAIAARRSTSTWIPLSRNIDEIFDGDVAARTWRKGAAAEPADRCVKSGDTGAHGRVGAGQTGSAGVVEVRAEWDVADHRAHTRDQIADAPRGGRADGVGDRQPVDIGLASRIDDVDDPLGRCRAVERAVPRRGDDDLHRGAAVVSDPDDLRNQCGRLRGGATDIRTAVSVGRRHHVFDRVKAGRDRPLCAVRAGHQRGELDVMRVPVLMQFGGEFGGVGQRGHLRR